MAKIKITSSALDKMKNGKTPYTLYLVCRGG